MAKTTKAAKGAAKARIAASSVGSNPYLSRVIEDEQLRNSVRTAFDAARDAYDRLSSNGNGPVNTMIDDKKVHKNLKVAAESLRDASERLREKQKSRRWSRLLMLGVVGAGLALVLSEDLRKKVLDKLFGAEEEFEYTSTTTSPSATSGDSAPAETDAGAASS